MKANKAILPTDKVHSFKREETSRERLLDMLATSIGPQILEYLEDPKIIEIMLNPDGCLWIDVLGKGCVYTGYKVTPEAAERVIRLVASSTKITCNEEHPIVSAELPGDGSRFQGMLPKVVKAPTFTIRKKALQVFTLDDYVKQGIMTTKQQKTIIDAVHTKKNILIVGGTGSGKTTLANAVLSEISTTDDRIIIIEDTMELQCTALNTVFLRSRENVTMNELLKATMRLRPDRIVVGEVRGSEALTLLKSWNTGHPGGCATVHANSAKGGLRRLEQLIQEAIPTPQRDLIADAVNLIIYIERYAKGRHIKEILLVEGYENDYILKKI